jgi:DUF1365 family protein
MSAVMYTGRIRHRRFAVREHAFSYRIALAYRELGETRGFLKPAKIRELVPDFDGPIRLLSTLRGFNPVSFYYCFDADETLRAIVAEVTNTPWGEKHAYVLGPRGGTFDKQFHVSPFMAMDHTYEVRATTPAETLSMHIESVQDGALAFDATLNLRRRPLRRRALAFASLRTLALIYAHGVALKLKGVPHHPHPRTEAS